MTLRKWYNKYNMDLNTINNTVAKKGFAFLTTAQKKVYNQQFARPKTTAPTPTVAPTVATVAPTVQTTTQTSFGGGQPNQSSGSQSFAAQRAQGIKTPLDAQGFVIAPTISRTGLTDEQFSNITQIQQQNRASFTPPQTIGTSSLQHLHLNLHYQTSPHHRHTLSEMNRKKNHHQQPLKHQPYLQLLLLRLL